MKIGLLLSIAVMLIAACDEAPKKGASERYSNVQSPIEVVRINSQRILDSLAAVSDSVYADTSFSSATSRGTFYLDKSRNVLTRILERPKGTIFGMTVYRNDTAIFSAEFFPNGQYACRFTFTEEGVRHGPYKCYYENGRIRSEGEYINGHEVRDKFARYDEEGYLLPPVSK